MVLLRRNIPLMSQEEIGYQLGLTVPKKMKKILPKARTGKKPIAGWGTQAQKPKHSINKFFERNNIKLKEVYVTL
jgi:ribosomal protein S24E